MEVVIVVAVAENGVIGREGDLPWHLPEDLKHFKNMTRGLPVVMGRATFESIGSKPLPGRHNFVVTSHDLPQQPGVGIVRSVDEAIELARTLPRPPEIPEERWAVCIVGGEGIYREALPKTRRIERTRVHATIPGDRVFPRLNPEEWRVTSTREHPSDDRHAYAMTFETLVRR